MAASRTWIGRVFIGVSLDGYIARPDGDVEWLEESAERSHALLESSKPAVEWKNFFSAIDHIVMGRATYEKVSAFKRWPYADKGVLVLSTTLLEDDERVQVVRSLDEAARVLTERGAKQVYVDGGRTIQDFLAFGLVDEITVSWAPILLGKGRPLFAEENHDIILTLAATHASDNGMVHATYVVEHPVPHTEG